MENQNVLNLPPNPEDNKAALITRQVEDEQGFGRSLYEISPNLSVMFRGREELPTVSTDAIGGEFKMTVLTKDERPRVVADLEYDTYIQDTVESDNELLVVNATPVGLLDLAARLRGETEPSPDTTLMRNNFLTGHVGEKENALLDMISAACFTDESSTDEKITRGEDLSDNLMSVVLALNGDKNIQAELNEKAKILAENEDGLVIKELGEDVLRIVFEHQPVDPDVIEMTKGLVLVRATDNAPDISDDGTVSVKPAAHYTRDIKGSKAQWFAPRFTTHFALNHYVASHLMGNFEIRKYVIVSPLDKTLEAGQKPATLFGADTYYTTGPGETLTLPGAVVIESAGNQAELFKQDGPRRLYKSEGFNDSDIDALIGECVNGQTNRLFLTDSESLSEEVRLRIIDNRLNDRAIKAGSSVGLCSRSGTFVKLDETGNRVEVTVPTAGELKKHGFKDTILKLAESNSKSLDILLSAVLSDISVELAITDQGGEVVIPDGHELISSGPNFNNRVDKIAEAMHAQSGQHSGLHESFIENRAIEMLHRRKSHRDERYDWEERDDEELNLSIQNSSQKIRRAMIEAGLLTVKGGWTKRQNEISEGVFFG